jgi:hypothetical protein
MTTLIRRGGVLFDREEFLQLQRCMNHLGNREFAVVEVPGSAESDLPPFRLRFPVAVTWEQLNSGNFISAILLEMPYKEYFVFGDTPDWGRLSASEHWPPFSVLGFRADRRTAFVSEYGPDSIAPTELAPDVPQVYRKRLLEPPRMQ